MAIKKNSRSFRGKRTNRTSFSKRVLGVLNTQRELKTAVGFFPQESMTNSFKLRRVLPDIPQGNTKYQRNGNSITLKKLVIRGEYHTIQLILNAQDTRLFIRQLILKQKGMNATDLLFLPGAYNVNNVLESSRPYNGTIIDYYCPLNKDAFIARRDRRMTLMSPASVPNLATGVGFMPDDTPSQTHRVFTITLTFGRGKKLFYQTSGSTQPDTWDYVMADAVSDLQTPQQISGSEVELNYNVTAFYFDS